MRRFAAVLVLFVAISCSKKETPPNPQPPPAKPAPITGAFDFALYGDCITRHPVHRHICEAIARTDARFVIQTGDMFNDKDVTPEEFMEVTRDLRAKMPYYAVKGNHDATPAGRFEKQFGLEKAYYDKTEGDVQFVFLDSCLLFQDAEQLAWLERTVVASTATYRIAVLHHCPVAMKEERAGEAQELRERLIPLLKKLGFGAVFCGHEHLFHATMLEGMRIVVTGGAGSHLMDIREDKLQPGDLARKAYHWILCHVDDHAITARVFDEDGQEIPDLHFTVCERK